MSHNTPDGLSYLPSLDEFINKFPLRVLEKNVIKEILQRRADVKYTTPQLKDWLCSQYIFLKSDEGQDRKLAFEEAISIISEKFIEFFQWLENARGRRLDYASKTPEELNDLLLKVFEIRLANTDRMRQAIDIIESELCIDIGPYQTWRGEIVNYLRQWLRKEFGSLYAVANQNPLTRRTAYLSKYGIVLLEFLSKGPGKDEFPRAKSLRRYLFPFNNPERLPWKEFVYPHLAVVLQRTSDQSSGCVISAMCELIKQGLADNHIDFAEGTLLETLNSAEFDLSKSDSVTVLVESFKQKLGTQLQSRIQLTPANCTAEAILISICNFKYSNEAKPEEQYRSTVWSTVFNAALSFSNVGHLLNGTPEYSMFKILSLFGISQTVYVDYGYILTARSGNVSYAAPIFILEASGFTRQKNKSGERYMAKDYTRLAVLMSICYRYWAAVLREYSADLKIYGCFVHQLEFQPCVVYGVKDANGGLSCLFECGKELSFTVDTIGQCFAASGNSACDWVTSNFPGEFRLGVAQKNENSADGSPTNLQGLDNNSVDESGVAQQNEDPNDECPLDLQEQENDFNDASHFVNAKNNQNPNDGRKLGFRDLDEDSALVNFDESNSGAASENNDGPILADSKEAVDFQLISSADALKKWVSLLVNFTDDIFYQARTLQDAISKTPPVEPNFGKPDYFPQDPLNSRDSHSKNSPAKFNKYNTPVKNDNSSSKINKAKSYARKNNLSLSDFDLAVFTRQPRSTLACHYKRDRMDRHSSASDTGMLVLKETLTPQEAELLRDLRLSSRIVDLYDFYFDYNENCLIMLQEELTDMRSIIGEMDRNITALVPSLYKFLLDGLQALHQLHSRGILHGDVSANNIMFSKRDDCFKLIDLGQASFIGSDGYGAVCRGTKKFIAPELRDAISGRCSPSSDIFALGKSFLRCFDWPIHEATIFCGMDWPEPLLQLWDFVVTDLISTDPHQRPTALNGFKTVLSMWQQHRVRFKTKLRYYNDYNVGKVEGTSTATADTFQSVVATSSVVGEEDEAIEMICD